MYLHFALHFSLLPLLRVWKCQHPVAYPHPLSGAWHWLGSSPPLPLQSLHLRQAHRVLPSPAPPPLFKAEQYILRILLPRKGQAKKEACSRNESRRTLTTTQQFKPKGLAFSLHLGLLPVGFSKYWNHWSPALPSPHPAEMRPENEKNRVKREGRSSFTKPAALAPLPRTGVPGEDGDRGRS